jgi:hypothetical protein
MLFFYRTPATTKKVRDEATSSKLEAMAANELSSTKAQALRKLVEGARSFLSQKA